jgi:O-antigen ligase
LSIGLLLIFFQRGILLTAFKAIPALWALFFLAWSSVFWSVDPLHTVRSSVLLSLCFVVGYTMATRVQPLHAWLTVFVMLGALLSAGAFWAYINPESGTDWGVAYKGFFGQKNWYGHAASIFILIGVGLLGWTRLFWQRVLILIFVSFGFWFLLKSQSVTALFGCLAGLSSMVVLYVLQRRLIPVWVLLSVLSFLAFVAMINKVEILAFFDRTPDMTGRWLIWQHLWPIMLEQPWLGYGYDAYLHAEGVLERLGVVKDVVINGGDTHNGFVRLMLDVGIVGVLLAVAVFCQLIARATKWINLKSISSMHYLCLGLWILILVHQIAEPSMFIPGHYTIALLVFSSIASCESFQKAAIYDR